MSGVVGTAFTGGSALVALLALIVAYLARRDARRSADAAEESAHQARRSADAEVRAVELAEGEAAAQAHAEAAPDYAVELAMFSVGTTARFRLRVLKAPAALTATVIVGAENWMGFAAGDSGFSSSDAQFDVQGPGDLIEGTVRRTDAFADDQDTDVLPLVVISESHEEPSRRWKQDILVRLERSHEF